MVAPPLWCDNSKSLIILKSSFISSLHLQHLQRTAPFYATNTRSCPESSADASVASWIWDRIPHPTVIMSNQREVSVNCGQHWMRILSVISRTWSISDYDGLWQGLVSTLKDFTNGVDSTTPFASSTSDSTIRATGISSLLTVNVMQRTTDFSDLEYSRSSQ